MTTRPENPATSTRGGLGFTLVEMIAALTILLLLTTVALPVAVTAMKRRKELTLHRDLRTMRTAIDHYKDFCDRGMIPIKLDTLGYPPDPEDPGERRTAERQRRPLQVSEKNPR